MSAPPQKRQRISVPEYLVGEERAEFENEYWNGMILPMAGCSPEHAGITANFGGEAGQRMKGRDCRGWSSQLRVKTNSGFYTYPDLAVVRGEPRFETIVRGVGHSLVNPTVLVEVLSPTTEARDRGFKFAQYRTLPSLRQYVLVHQDQPRVEVFTRQADDQWLFREHVGLDAAVALESVGVEIPLAEIYLNIEWPSAEAPVEPA